MPDSNVLSDGDILDIVESRRKEYTQKYFMSIPKQEWDRVEYLCCDMYNPYISYTYSYTCRFQWLFLRADPNC